MQRGGKPTTRHGFPTPTSANHSEVASFEDAKRCYAAEYAATIQLRNQSANSSLILVDGYEAPKGR